jgi:magnesium transporter
MFQPGAAPGLLRVDPEARRPSLHVIAYGPAEIREIENATLQDVARLRGALPVLWLNVSGLGDAAILEGVAQMFSIHPLALEDIVNVHQQAKVEDYGDTLFIVARTAVVEGLGHHQVSLVLGDGFIVTFLEGDVDPLVPIRERLRTGRKVIRSSGPDYLAYAVVDAVIDSYFPALDSVADRMDALEQEALLHPGKDTIPQIQALKAELRELRAASWPHRDLANALLRPTTPRFSDQTRLYLRDCADHASRVTDLLESAREGITDLMNAYLSSASNRMNEVMKVLTIIASIFIPLSFIAGLYGMNFDPEASRWNMPELEWAFGYPAVLGVMAVVGLGMLYLFHRRGWF